MKKLVAFIIAFSVGFSQLNAQDTTEKMDVAIFAPFYLDSAFTPVGGYKYNNTVPRYLVPSLDFYQGLSLALDSLNNAGVKLNVSVYDTRNAKQTIYNLADNGALNNTGLIIGAVSGSEYLDLATIAKEKKLPFISVSYPNDGGITANPYVLMVSPKLNTHLQAIYNFVLKNYNTGNLVLFRRKGAADDRIANTIQFYNGGANAVLNIKTVTLATPVTLEAITASLDASRDNIIICGSIDEQFGKALITNLGKVTSRYKITLIGMPTWEGYRELTSMDVRALPVIYSSAFYNPEEEGSWADNFSKLYAKTTYSPANELAFKGYETMFLFGNLLKEYGSAGIIGHANEKKYRVLTDFDFRPIQWKKESTSTDYYENKRIYILKRLNGIVTKEN